MVPSSPRIENPKQLSLDRAPPSSSVTTASQLVVSPPTVIISEVTEPVKCGELSKSSSSIDDNPRINSSTQSRHCRDYGNPKSIHESNSNTNSHNNNNTSNNNNNDNDTMDGNSITPQSEQSEQQLIELQLQHHQRRITSSLSESSEVVHSLFGTSVGPCWGDFSCTHLRIRGRLYATSQAILFYTTLLGAFERRICLLLRDVADMELFRTTSIRIHTTDLETYIFKSFNDREQVLHLLNGLKILSNRKQRGTGSCDRQGGNGSNDTEDTSVLVTNRRRNDSDSRAATERNSGWRGLLSLTSSKQSATTLSSTMATELSPPSPSVSTASRGTIVENELYSMTNSPSEQEFCPPSKIQLPFLPPTQPPHLTPHRKRAASDSFVRSIDSVGEDNERTPILSPRLVTTTEGIPRTTLEPIKSVGNVDSPEDGHKLFSSTDDLMLPARTSNQKDFERDDSFQDRDKQSSCQREIIWEKMKQSKNQLQQVGLESLTLPCSLDEYHKLFLADDAAYPLDYYQKEYVKDTNVDITGWDISTSSTFNNTDIGDTCCFQRTITFTHPIKNSMGIGPSSAETTRQQRLHRYPGIGLVLENKTFVEGLPGADCFFVQDLWLLEEPEKEREGLENNNHSSCKLTVQFDVIFHKRSLFKNIIQKSVRKETKQWIAGYVDMVQSVLGDRTGQVRPCNVKRNVSNGSRRENDGCRNEGEEVLISSEAIRPKRNDKAIPLSAPQNDLIELSFKQVKLFQQIIVGTLVVLSMVVGFLAWKIWSMHLTMLKLESNLQLVVENNPDKHSSYVETCSST